ncbi:MULTISPECIES: dTMP kinase [unclassified Phycicoccus]|uniref:dTMP kinase n=1 Tax=unclassified Phycicoccus TaxID=2637926 RepID=UPI000702DA65|nr:MULTISPECIES: dTMP kinase [unclassified Phycicoccus]KQU65431.1 thymidylate kinase [Phycicoccus sp. Root101]KQZ89443.1 thymidylate kinase [Phycicoccus sp. Root563]
MTDGLFIAFEGGDGAGKSTQVALLRDALQAAGRTVTVTRQPGGTDLGHQIRDLVLHGAHVAPRAEALLFAADKAHHVDQLIRPALDRGEVVLTDRYTDSSVAYQGAGRDLGAQEIHDLNMWAVDELVPDLTVIVDVSAQEGRRRRGEVHDRLEAEADAFHEAIRAHFLAMAEGNPQRYLVVDGTLPPDEIHAAVLARLRSLVVLP